MGDFADGYWIVDERKMLQVEKLWIPITIHTKHVQIRDVVGNIFLKKKRKRQSAIVYVFEILLLTSSEIIFFFIPTYVDLRRHTVENTVETIESTSYCIPFHVWGDKHDDLVAMDSRELTSRNPLRARPISPHFVSFDLHFEPTFTSPAFLVL